MAEQINILITGFEPFAGEATNPTADLLAPLAARSDALLNIQTALLPVSYGADVAAWQEARARTQPDWTFLLGLAAGREELTVERVALNLVDSRVPDNSGQQPVDEPVIAGAPNALFCDAGVKPLLTAFHAAGLAARPSLTAGAFVCNHLFYQVLHAEAQAAPRNASSFFVHVPHLATIGLDLETFADRLAKGIRVFLANPDAKVSEALSDTE